MLLLGKKWAQTPRLKRKKSGKEIVLMLDKVRIIPIRSSTNWRIWVKINSKVSHQWSAKGNYLIFSQNKSLPLPQMVISHTLIQLLLLVTKTSSLSRLRTRQMLSIKTRVLLLMARTLPTRNLRTKITTYTQSMCVSIGPELDSNVNSGTPSSLSTARSMLPSSSQATLFTEKRIVYDIIITSTDYHTFLT